MLNEKLLDPKDVEIFKLKNTIEKFKKYDADRKEYYKNLAIRVGELESLVQEFENGSNILELKNKIKRQSSELSRLNSLVKMGRYTEKELTIMCSASKVKLNEKITNLENKIHELREQLKSERNTNDRLWSTIAKYRNKYGNLD